MPQRILEIIDFIIPSIMTFVSYLMGFSSIVLMTSWVSFFGLIPAILATLYWIPKLKKQIKDNHNGSVKSWVKSYFKF